MASHGARLLRGSRIARWLRLLPPIPADARNSFWLSSNRSATARQEFCDEKRLVYFANVGRVTVEDSLFPKGE